MMFSLSISAQKKECYSFVNTFDLIDSLQKKTYCREFYSDNMFHESLFVLTGAVFFKNEKNEWFIQKDSIWTCFFSEEKAKDTIFCIDNFDIGIQFKKTIYTCNESQLYHVMYKSLNSNVFIHDYGDYFFTPKDGFIIIFRGDNYLIRNDMIFFFKELIYDSTFLRTELLKTYENY